MNKFEVDTHVMADRINYRPSSEEEYFATTKLYPDRHEQIRGDRLVMIKAFTSAVIPVLERHLQDNIMGSFLEVGCGTGFFTRHLAPGWLLKMDLESIDLNEPSLQMMRESGYQGQTRKASVYQLPYQRNSLDAVIGYSSFDSLTFLNRAIAEVRQVLKPKGKLVLFQDLITDTYSFADDPEKLTAEERSETIERYHGVLIDEVKMSGLRILEGEQEFLETIEVESIQDVAARVPDFEERDLPFPIFAFWLRGRRLPILRKSSREKCGLTLEDVDAQIKKHSDNPRNISIIKKHCAKKGDLVEVLKL